MTSDDRRVLELAIQALEMQQVRLAEELNALRRRLSGSAREPAQTLYQSIKKPRPAPNKGKPMSAAQKRKISRSMKARWSAVKASNVS